MNLNAKVSDETKQTRMAKQTKRWRKQRRWKRIRRRKRRRRASRKKEKHVEMLPLRLMPIDIRNTLKSIFLQCININHKYSHKFSPSGLLFDVNFRMVLWRTSSYTHSHALILRAYRSARLNIERERKRRESSSVEWECAINTRVWGWKCKSCVRNHVRYAWV